MGTRGVSRGANALGAATSPYLRQHADNPVHWQQWTPEALAEAASRDVPILLSVGYAACHWCHVMAHESFEDDEVAAAMNAGFVCIKVDREERPDLDAVYMNATVALTGQGGWPMTCFLTPDGGRSSAARTTRRRGSCNCSPRSPTRGATVAPRWSRPPNEIAGELRVDGVRPARRRTRAGTRAVRSRRGRRAGATRTSRAADSAVRRSSRRRRCWRRCCAATSGPATRRALATVERTCDGDGPRRHLRPARRRLRPLQRRRVVGGAALREDALRQRAAAAGVRALGAADREIRWRAR